MNLWSAFGLVWNSDIALNHFAVGDGAADVIVRRVGQLHERKVVKAINRGAVRADGIRFVCEGQAIFDMVGGNRVDYVTGIALRGATLFLDDLSVVRATPDGGPSVAFGRPAIRLRWMAAIPGGVPRRAAMLAMPEKLQFAALPVVGAIDDAGFHTKATEVMGAIRELLAESI